jgi:hypothetical protein
MPAFVLPERGAFSVDPDRDFISPARFYAVTGRRQLLIRLVGRCNTFHLLLFLQPARLVVGRIAPPGGAANGRCKDGLAASTQLYSPAKRPIPVNCIIRRAEIALNATPGGTLVGSAIE